MTKIPGPVPQEPSKSSEPVRPGTDKFKEFMKIGESDKRQGKKRQQREEAASKKGAQRTGVASEKISESTRKQRAPKIQKVDESQKRQPQQKKRPEETAALDEEAAAQQATQQKIEAFDVSKVETSSLENKKAAASSYTPPAAEEEVKQQITAKEEKAEEIKVFARQQELKKAEAAQPPAAPAASILGPNLIPPAPETAPGYANFSKDVYDLFEKMVSQIFIMKTSGVTETTLHIDDPTSRFAGSQIRIVEFSTAPLSYNIELLGSPQNALYFEQNIASLKAAFSSEKRNFTIHEIKTSIKAERPEHRRVERKNEEGMT